MSDEPKTKPPAAPHEHVFEDRWYPLDRKHIRRVCVIPRCGHREIQAAKA